MPGYFNMSLQQQLDPRTGAPAVGAKLYFYEGGTSTPLTVYRDYTVGVEHPNPITLDGYGRIPAVYLAGDGTFYRSRLTMSDGTLSFDVDGIPVIGPTVSGGGGDPVTPVDARALAQTGDEKLRYDTSFHDGWVRENGRTIGSASSGATERANADCEALFLHLWQKDVNLSVSGGRGASAAADWAANKTIALPDARGNAIVGLDGMGSGTTTGRLPAAAVTSTGGGVNVLGSSGGAGTHTLTIAETPAHDHNVAATQEAHHHTVPISRMIFVQTNGHGIATGTGPIDTSDAQPVITVTEDSIGGGTAHNNMQPFTLRCIYIKL